MLAIGLIKHGVNVHVYEAAKEFSEIGAGVSFSQNSMKALQLIDPRLLEGFKKHNTVNLDPGRADIFMTARWGMDERRDEVHKAGDFVFQLRDRWTFDRAKSMGVCARNCIHRARLLDVLVDLLPKGVTTFDKRFEDVEELDDGMLRLHFKDGTTALASALIGCDGIKSQVRNFVSSRHVQPTFDNEVAYRAMVPRAAAEAALGPEVALNGHIYCGYGAYIVQYPVENREFINVVACRKDASYNGKWEHDDWTAPATKDEIARLFKGWYPPLINVITQFALPSKWAMYFLRHNEPYYKGRTCLLGDSAHAAMPHLGGGAGMAMEDAYILSNLIASVPGVDDLEEAFRAYDAIRRPRAHGLVERCQDAMKTWCLEDADARDNMKVVEERLLESFRWLWDEHLEEDLQRGRDMLSRGI